MGDFNTVHMDMLYQREFRGMDDYSHTFEWWMVEKRAEAEAQVAALEAENERLREVAREAYRIHNEAHLQADHYAYDLMRTVLRSLEDKKGLYPALKEIDDGNTANNT